MLRRRERRGRERPLPIAPAPELAEVHTHEAVAAYLEAREHRPVVAFRALHGYGEREDSWTFPQNKRGWRLDHVLVYGLRPIDSAYAHGWRRAGLSDQSPLVVDLAR